MSASFTEVPVGFPRNPGLLLGNGFDREFPDTRQVVEAAAGDSGRGSRQSTIAVSSKFAAETRLLVALSMALAQLPHLNEQVLSLQRGNSEVFTTLV
jgi:hypothetical protein